MIQKTTIIALFLTSLCVGVLLDVFHRSVVFGADDIAVQLQIPVGTAKSFTVCTADDASLSCNGLAEYIVAIYRWVIGLAAVLAVLALTWGGVQWMTSGGDSGKIQEGRKVMINAIIGFLLALGSYTMLYAINPDLVQFSPISIPKIQKIDLDLEPVESEVDEPISFSGTGTTYSGLPHLSLSPGAKADLETPGIIDPKMISFLNKLDKIAEETGILYHISLNRGHSIHVKGTNRKSQHKFGTAVDISYKLAKEDPKLIELAQKLIEIHKKNPDELKIRQLIFSSSRIPELIYANKISDPRVYRGALPGHKPHIHVGVDSAGSFHSFRGDPN